jgi:PTH1 family peptidyl-tRNA hydrolase
LLNWMKSLLSFRNAATKDFLIVGLGNPGRAYEKTRHNVGFRAVRSFAKKYSISLKEKERMSAEIGTGRVHGIITRIVLPQTYMNSSGEAVLKALKTFKLKPDQMVVVVDDIAFPVGAVRFKEEGSAGGHNGLKSIEDHLGTKQFPRIRIGVGHPSDANWSGDLAGYVLSPFDAEDEQKLPDVFNHVASVMECWILEGIKPAMTLANTKIR